MKYTWDARSVWVTTKASAPGGARTEKVGLPFSPDLYDHMLEHGVYIDDDAVSDAATSSLTHPRGNSPTRLIRGLDVYTQAHACVPALCTQKFVQ